MAELSIKYKDKTSILEHDFEIIDAIKFILVYKTGEFSFKKIEFTSADEAYDYANSIDQTIDKEKMLFFLSITSKINKNGNVHIINKPLRIYESSIFIDNFIDVRNRKMQTSISFDDCSIKIIGNYYGKDPHLEVIYNMETPYKSEIINHQDLLDTLCKFIPRYADIFIQLMFIKHMIETSGVETRKDIYDYQLKDIEAYFLQEKSILKENKLESSSDNIVLQSKETKEKLNASTKKGDNEYLVGIASLIGIIFLIIYTYWNIFSNDSHSYTDRYDNTYATTNDDLAFIRALFILAPIALAIYLIRKKFK